MRGALEGFAYSRPQEVVLRDLDAFGHVNNAVFLTYVENARVSYLAQVVGARRRDQIRNIMVRVSISYRAQVSYEDELESGVRTERLGGKSFDLRYLIVRKSDGETVAEAESVQVMYDFDADRSIELPAEWRRAIEAHDGLSGGVREGPA
ncbi:MAG TPA: thioesterase family protein [Solirubrobacterales bacterium]|nr:thioesterase family protein [Solirubrobacterales bacterium]